MKIYLIGYMGSGKSTLGKGLAAEFGISWIDLDDEFTRRYKITIPDFFVKYGEIAFRELEHKILIDISLIPDILVSTGGGLPCFYDNLQIMNQTGITVYLKASPDLIISRIDHSSRSRPVFRQMKGENFREKINSHLLSREVYYNQAKITVDAENPNPAELKGMILSYPTTISGE